MFHSWLIQTAVSLFKKSNFSSKIKLKSPGEVYNVECGWEGKECHKPLEDFIEEWINLGVKIVGGCCRINANDIAIIKQKIESLRS